MKINTSYPYPVLYMNNDDYKNSSFHASINVHKSFGEVKASVRFTLENEEIESLIENRTFVYAVHIECGQSSFRNVYKSSEKVLEISIPSNKIRGKVFFHTFILVNKSIENYTNKSFNKWFKDLQFSLEKGNIVAIGEAVEINLYEDPTELLNLPSIVTVRKSLKKEFMEVDLDSNEITISLPEYEYNQYAANANSRLKNTILSFVILPALVFVFTKVNENREDYQGYTWYQVLEKIFEENNVRLDEIGSDALPALKAAQMVLRKPLRSSFDEIEKLSRSED